MTVVTLSATCLTLGLGSGMSRTEPWLSFVAPAVAQSPQALSNDDVKNYAQAVLAIEPIRQAAYNEIKKLVGSGDIPAIACNQPDSLKNLPGNTRGIAVNYCNQSKKIVESNGLTISRFNAITLRVQEDPSLEKRIQTELIRLQRAATP